MKLLGYSGWVLSGQNSKPHIYLICFIVFSLSPCVSLSFSSGGFIWKTRKARQSPGVSFHLQKVPRRSVMSWFSIFPAQLEWFKPELLAVWFSGPMLVAGSLISSSQIRQGQSRHIKPLSRKLLPSAAGSDWPAAEVCKSRGGEQTA